MKELTEKELFYICVELGLMDYEPPNYKQPSQDGSIEMIEIKDKNKN